MEQNLEMSALLQTDLLEDPNPDGEYDSTSYADRPLPSFSPDTTSLAGTVADIYQKICTFRWQSQHKVSQTSIATCTRLAQLHGKVEILSSTATRRTRDKNASGDWIELETNSGRSVDETLPDVLLTHTPTPLNHLKPL